MIPDAELLDQIKNKNHQAFTIVYNRYKTSVFGYCVRMLLDRDAAEDATHETFFKLYTHADSLHSPQALHAWLLTTARNEVMMFFRRKRHNGTSDENEVWEDQTPHEVVVSRETTDVVNSLIEQLKSEYREVIVLREYEGLSYAEIASMTGDSESSVKSRLFKARKALIEKLKPYYR